MDEFRSGYVAIVGKPNAGKSTLLNALIGEKIAIVTEKPQTTRDRIQGILTTDRFQIVFIDTPGIIPPKDRFNEILISRAMELSSDVDLVYHLVDATDPAPANDEISAVLDSFRPDARLLVVNKIDQAKLPIDAIVKSLTQCRDYAATIPISALRKRNLDKLIAETSARLPLGPIYYDPTQLSDRDERFLAAEIVREKVFLVTGEEIPYAVHTETETFEERETKDFIRVIIYVERESQKPIIIGRNGHTLKKIGEQARRDVEQLTGRPAFLELWVKVRKNWRKSDFDLNDFGFKAPRRKRKQ